MNRICILFFLLFSGNCSFCQNSASLPELLEKLKKAGNAEKAGIYNQVSAFYLYQEKSDSALYYCNLSLKMTGLDEKDIADTYNQMGIIYRLSSNNEKSMDFYVKALKIYEKNGLYKKAARTLGNISILFSDELKHDQALKNALLAVNYSIQVNDTITLSILYGSIFYDYLQLKNLPKAREYLSRSLALLKAMEAKSGLTPRDTAEIVNLRTNINYMKATLNTEEGKFRDAIVIYLQELKDGGNEMGVSSQIDAYKGLSENYYLLKEYRISLGYTDSILHLLKIDSIPYSYMDVYAQRAKIFAGLGLFEEAYKHHILYKNISDSLLNAANFKSISNLKVNYETEKKDQQILLLSREKKAQRIVLVLAIGAGLIALCLLALALRSRRLQQKVFRQKEELMAKEKEVEKKELEQKMAELEQMALRAQMNPHFIFNSLNSVQHFVMNHDVEGVNKYLAAFAHLIRQTLNNSGKQLISIEEEIKYLDTYLSLERMKSGERFKYTINADENIDTSKTYIPGMILQPFVENSIKHGVAHKTNDDGFINIRISKNGKLVCRIEDNGVGRQKAGEIKKTTTSEYESRGMDITLHRIDAINKLYNTDVSVHVADLQDTAGNVLGTCVTVDLPPDLD